MATVKRGGREDYLCAGCGEIIEKGKPHVRKGNSPNFKRFHEGCVDKKPATAEAPAPETRPAEPAKGNPSRAAKNKKK